MPWWGWLLVGMVIGGAVVYCGLAWAIGKGIRDVM